jgi:hypothetical protein
VTNSAGCLEEGSCTGPGEESCIDLGAASCTGQGEAASCSGLEAANCIGQEEASCIHREGENCIDQEEEHENRNPHNHGCPVGEPGEELDASIMLANLSHSCPSCIMTMGLGIQRTSITTPILRLVLALGRLLLLLVVTAPELVKLFDEFLEKGHGRRVSKGMQA